MANKGTLRNFKYLLTNVPVKMKICHIDIILYLVVLKGEVNLLNLGSPKSCHLNLSVKYCLTVFFCKGTGGYNLGPAETHILQEQKLKAK